MSRIRDLHAGWMEDPAYRQECEALEGEFTLAAALIGARADAGLAQERLAARIGNKREVIARWEGGKVLPSTRTLTRLARATGTTLRISFAPAPGGSGAGRFGKSPVARSRRQIA